MLKFLYKTRPGRVLLKPLTSRPLSQAAGAFLDTRASKVLIKPFVKANDIDLNDYESDNFKCFNDCFTRQIKDGLRPVDMTPEALVAPSDGLLRAYEIQEDTVMPVKESRYSVADLLGHNDVYKRFIGGTCLVFRLTVHHYHRYAFFDSGLAHNPIFIPGKLHTVQPIALREEPVFTENCREFTVIDSDNFGTAVQMEVGAMLVGRISNHDIHGRVLRGQEKGAFEYGGSTIILLLEPGAAKVDPQYFGEEEIEVVQGQRIGSAR